MNVLSLFAGIGGLELGLERAGLTTVGQVEKDPYCLRVLAKHWPEVPRHDDVRTAAAWWQGQARPAVDVICGGFPCQDISNAGRRAGIGGERSGLWTYMADTVRVLRPRYVVMENVSAILVRGLDVVAGDLAAIGYDVQWDCIPAAAVGAPHRRDRWWGIATAAESIGRETWGLPIGARPEQPESGLSDPHLADAQGERRGQGWQGRPAGNGQDGQTERSEALADTDDLAGASPIPLRVFSNASASGSLNGIERLSRPGGQHWAVEPDVGRVAHGVPKRVDRLRALGNAVVPQVAEHIGQLLVEVAA